MRLHGGGNGAPSESAWVYGYTFDPEDPNVDITANGSGRRQDWYDRVCNGYVVGSQWVDSPVGGAPAITAAGPGAGHLGSSATPTSHADRPHCPGGFEANGFAFV